MFQYAFGRSLALKNNTDLLLDTKDYETYTLHAYGLDNYPIVARAERSGGPRKFMRIFQGMLPLSMRSYIQITSNHFFPKVLIPSG